MPSTAEIAALIRAAREVRPRAYAPYSKFQVGAALRATDGRVFAGVNVENAAYPTGVCAERNAIGVAIAAGAREFDLVAIVTPLDGEGRPGSPCGECRQALYEQAPSMLVVLAGPEGDAYEELPLAALLPRAFGPKSL